MQYEQGWGHHLSQDIREEASREKTLARRVTEKVLQKNLQVCWELIRKPVTSSCWAFTHQMSIKPTILMNRLTFPTSLELRMSLSSHTWQMNNQLPSSSVSPDAIRKRQTRKLEPPLSVTVYLKCYELSSNILAYQVYIKSKTTELWTLQSQHFKTIPNIPFYFYLLCAICQQA